MKFANRDRWLLFVDDGSPDETNKILERAAQEHPFVMSLSLKTNLGKGEAVRSGYLHLKSSERLKDFEWVGFWDADLATPLSEVSYLLSFADDSIDAVLGSRILRLGAQITRSPVRHFFGRGFALIVERLFKIKAHDTQCGAKLFRQSVLHKVFSEPFLSRWIFDVEILLRLKGHRVVECSLREWHDVPGGNLRIGREFLRVVKDLIRIRREHVRSKTT